MSYLAGGRRLGEGLPALRKRYIARAETLLDDEEFQRFIHETRRDWNDHAPPPYRITRASDVEGVWPTRLHKDLRQFGLLAKPLGKCPEKASRRAFVEAKLAGFAWIVVVIGPACERFFPPEDFESPHDPRRGHPAAGFLAAALAADQITNLRDRAGRYFPPFRLRHASPAPSMILLYAFHVPELEARVLEGLMLYLPHGHTAQDLVQVAADIAMITNNAAPHLTPWARVQALIEAGVNMHAISRRLGLKVKTLKNARTPRNPR